MSRALPTSLLLLLLASMASGQFTYQPNVDYNEGQPSLAELHDLTLTECCQACANRSDCSVSVLSAWYDLPPHACFLKPSNPTPVWKSQVMACWPEGRGPIPPPPPPGPIQPLPPAPQCYTAFVDQFDEKPVVSFVDNSSAFPQVFNPSWIVSSPGTNGKEGLLVRTQNCSAGGGCYCVGCKCCGCGGSGPLASVLTFAELETDDNTPYIAPRFKFVDNSSVVFAPIDKTDYRGTEDPRVAYDANTGIYYVFYTCYGELATLCLATTLNPTSPDNWTRLGPVGFGPDSKSAALLLRDDGNHYLFWGAGQIRVTTSRDATKWTPGDLFITSTVFGNGRVEAGPPPMLLSTGDYVFFHNSWDENNVYMPAWVILNGTNPAQIIARAQEPLWKPDMYPWMQGQPPYTCNVGNVAFLEAAHPTSMQDVFRVYFGGSDAVVGSALVKVQQLYQECQVVL